MIQCKKRRLKLFHTVNGGVYNEQFLSVFKLAIRSFDWNAVVKTGRRFQTFMKKIWIMNVSLLD